MLPYFIAVNNMQNICGALKQEKSKRLYVLLILGNVQECKHNLYDNIVSSCSISIITAFFVYCSLFSLSLSFKKKRFNSLDRVLTVAHDTVSERS